MSNEKKIKVVEISHGGGGKRMDQLISFITEHIGETGTNSNDIVSPTEMDDSAVIQLENNQSKIVLTTDSHTVDPIFFNGGNIGDLTIAGTVNDLTVMGAKPVFLTLGMVIEEGYTFENLGKICRTIGERARSAGIRIVAGDTKVMPKGTLSEIILNSAGVGFLQRENAIKDSNAKPGDKIIISGYLGDHGSSLMAVREGMEFETDLKSDVAPLWPTLETITKRESIHCMKDITRGGLASASNEIASKSGVCLKIDEEKIPIRVESQAICDILGLEIMQISCEGTVICVVDSSDADLVLEEMKKYELTQNAAIIGEVEESPSGQVHIITDIGGTRLLDKPYGEPIPRVC